MSTFIESLLLTSNPHPYLIGLLILTPLAIFLAFSLFGLGFVGLGSSYHDCEDDAIFIHDETRPLLPHRNDKSDGYDSHQDPLKDYPYGKFVTRSVSAKRVRRQEVNRAVLRKLLERDWRESSYSYGGVGGRGPRVGEKRKKTGAEGEGRGKRARVEGGEEGDDE